MQPGLAAYYNIRPGNEEGLFFQPRVHKVGGVSV